MIEQDTNLVPEIQRDLVDIDYGDRQGRTPDETHSLWPDMGIAWRNMPQLARIPGGETLDKFLGVR